MNPRHLRFIAISLPILAVLTTMPADAALLEGTVLDVRNRPIAGAHVRRQGTDELAITDATGAFSLDVASPADNNGMYIVGFARKGYLNQVGGLVPGAGYEIHLEALFADNPDYRWIPADPDSPLSPFNPALGCGNCHNDQYEAWKTSRHAAAATDPFVLDLYTGSGAKGALSRQGAGYLQDQGGRAGPCANCHAVTAVIDAGGETRLDEVTGVHLQGVYCETCHKVADLGDDLTLTPATGAFKYVRPQNGVIMAFGPLDDAADSMHMGPMSFMPDMSDARFCAGCHEWTNEKGIAIMETYSEWSKSEFAALGLRCQDCHMRSLDHTQSARPRPPADFTDGDPFCILRNPLGERQSADDYCDRMGAVLRPEKTIHPHTFQGTTESYMVAAATLDVQATRAKGVIDVTVNVENINAGHMLPTGMPFREIFLVVRATNAAGASLELLEGATLPSFVGDGIGGALPGSAGRAFTKRLGDAEGNPTDLFWKAESILEDTRIPPLGADVSHYRFVEEAGSSVTVDALLYYRRFTDSLAKDKAWSEPDVLMATRATTVEPAAASSCSSTPGGNAGLALFVLGGVLAFSLRRRASATMTVAMTVFLVGCPGKNQNDPLPANGIEENLVALLATGATCPGDGACESSRCVATCGGAHVCAKASCSADTDCTVSGSTTTFCCQNGACIAAPGGACGSRDGAAGTSCAVGGSTDCGAEATCVNACRPSAVCATSCSTDAQCTEIDPATGLASQRCTPVDSTARYCLDDRWVVDRCASNDDCRDERDDAVCDFFLAPSGTDIVTVCTWQPYGPVPAGGSCVGPNGPDPRACDLGMCWTGGGFLGTCSAVCRLSEGDADCTCDPAITGCRDQICIPYPFRISQTDPNLRATVPLCYEGTRCQTDDDCPTLRHCATADLLDELQLICMPYYEDGEFDGATCQSNDDCASTYCTAGTCAARKRIGMSCTTDDECLNRCIENMCTGPCLDAAWCVSHGAGTRCAATDIPYGPAGSVLTRSVDVCLP